MKRMTLALILSTAALTAASLAQAGTQAGSAGGTRLQYRVNYSDLNLTQLDGATKLYSRLQAAARVVCRPLDRPDLGSFKRHRACMQDAVSTAVVDVNKPVLTAYFEARGGHFAATAVQASAARP